MNCATGRLKTVECVICGKSIDPLTAPSCDTYGRLAPAYKRFGSSLRFNKFRCPTFCTKESA